MDEAYRTLIEDTSDGRRTFSIAQARWSVPASVGSALLAAAALSWGLRASGTGPGWALLAGAALGLVVVQLLLEARADLTLTASTLEVKAPGLRETLPLPCLPATQEPARRGRTLRLRWAEGELVLRGLLATEAELARVQAALEEAGR